MPLIRAGDHGPTQDGLRRPTAGGPEVPLRIQVVSDLIGSPPHGGVAHAPDVDFVVAAGDLAGSAVDAVRRLRETFPAPERIVMVLGERDLAGADHVTSVARARAAAKDNGVTLLENEVAVVGGVRFVGATFWSDFRLLGDDARTIEAAMDVAEAPFRALDIRNGHGRHLDPYGSMWEHARSRVFVTLALRERFAGPTVVVTHHAPSALCLGPGRVDDPMAPALASRLDDTVRCSGAALWVHGHVPDPVDLVIGRTRVVAAPHRPGRVRTVVELEGPLREERRPEPPRSGTGAVPRRAAAGSDQSASFQRPRPRRLTHRGLPVRDRTVHSAGHDDDHAEG